jgi:hypothetical protein
MDRYRVIKSVKEEADGKRYEIRVYTPTPRYFVQTCTDGKDYGIPMEASDIFLRDIDSGRLTEEQLADKMIGFVKARFKDGIQGRHNKGRYRHNR